MTREGYLGLGSNVGDRRANLQAAVDALPGHGVEVLGSSSVYETEPVGVPDEQPAYLNMVAELSLATLKFTPRQVLARLLRIEYALGRRRTRPLAPRTLDLDLIAYGRLSGDLDGLILPHPRAAERKFVMGPLAEIAPGWRHPGGGRAADLADAAPIGRDATPAA